MAAKGHTPIATAWHVLDAVVKVVAFFEAAYFRGSSKVASTTLHLLLDKEYRSRIEYRIGGNVYTMVQSCHEKAVKRVEVILLDCQAGATYIPMKLGQNDEADDPSRNLWANHRFMRMNANDNVRPMTTHYCRTLCCLALTALDGATFCRRARPLKLQMRWSSNDGDDVEGRRYRNDVATMSPRIVGSSSYRRYWRDCIYSCCSSHRLIVC